MPKLNLKSSRAMHIRENFQVIYLAKNIDEFKQLLQKWFYGKNGFMAKMVIMGNKKQDEADNQSRQDNQEKLGRNY